MSRPLRKWRETSGRGNLGARRASARGLLLLLGGVTGLSCGDDTSGDVGGLAEAGANQGGAADEGERGGESGAGLAGAPAAGGGASGSSGATADSGEAGGGASAGEAGTTQGGEAGSMDPSLGGGGGSSEGGASEGGAAGGSEAGAAGGPEAGCEPEAVGCDDLTPVSCQDGAWRATRSACPFACVGGACAGECAAGATRCLDNVFQGCNADYEWEETEDCPAVCNAEDGCVASCESGTFQCNANQRQECTSAGVWGNGQNCSFVCEAGACTGVCDPGDEECQGTTARSCGSDGEWHGVACPNACLGGACVACDPGDERCAEGASPGRVQRCSESGTWLTEETCQGTTLVCGPCGLGDGCSEDEECLSDFCSDAGLCANPPVLTCPAGSLLVPGGSFPRGQVGEFLAEPVHTATVDSFCLDEHEVTVERFRVFIEGYDAWLGAGNPIEEAAEHPLISGTGWQSAWDAELPADETALRELVTCSPTHVVTWTADAAGNELLPMSCMSWFEAFAFCAWDGGRLPTAAEWEYAAAGGDEDRNFPWGSTSPDPALHAVFACLGEQCFGEDDWDLSHILPVGSRPLGAGRWGHRDLTGSMNEWLLDDFVTYDAVGCNNCAAGPSTPPVPHSLGGGSWETFTLGSLNVAHRWSLAADSRRVFLGARCARSLELQ